MKEHNKSHYSWVYVNNEGQVQALEVNTEPQLRR